MVTLAALALPAVAGAASIGRLLEDGNSDYGAGDFSKAMQQYEQAVELAPDDPVARFNLGAAEYRQGQFEAAINDFETAADLAAADKKNDLAAKSFFNLGNSLYRQSAAEQQSDSSAALASLELGAGYFRKAITLDPGLAAAGHNLELTRQQIKLLKEQIRQQQQEQASREKAGKELAEKLQELAARQQRLAEKNRGQNQQQPSEAEAQKELRQETEDLAGQLAKQDETGPDQSKEAAAAKMHNAVSEQKKAEDMLQSGEPEQADAAQEQAAADLRQALAELQDKEEGKQSGGDQEQGANGKNNASTAAQDNKADNGEASDNAGMEPAASQAGEPQTAQEILAAEKAQRQQRQQRTRFQPVPVDKDW